MTDRLEIATLLDQLVSKCCTEVYGGISLGSHAIILLGSTKSHTIDMKIRGEARSCDVLKADVEIFIEDTHWELLERDHVIITSDSPSGYDSPMYRGFQILIGKEVTSVELDGNANLALRFTEYFSLVTNCRKDLADDESNFSVVIGDRQITVGADCSPAITARPH